MNSNTWKKNLLVLSISQFFYRAGTRSVLPFLPLFIKEIGKTSTPETALWSGWVLAAPFMVSFFTTPFWGTIGDKIGRKYTTFLAVFGFALSQLFVSQSSSLILVFIAFSVQELFGGAYPAAISLTASNTPKDKTASALSYLQFSNSLGNIIGPLLGGLVADYMGFKSVFIIISILVTLTSLPILIFVKEATIQKENRSYSLIKNISSFFNKPILLICGLLLLAYTTSVTMMRPNFTLFLVDNFLSIKNISTTAGLILTLFGAASSISTLFLPKFLKVFQLKNLLLISFVSSGLIFISLFLLHNIYAFGLFLFLLGFFLGVILPLIYSIISDNVDALSKAGVMGIGSSFQMIGNLSGPIIAGYLVSVFGVNFSFIGCGIVLLSAILFFKLMDKQSETIN